MGWKKLLSLAIIHILITSGLAIIGSQQARADEGEQIHTIDFRVNLGIESHVEEVYEGEQDLFSHSIDGPIYQWLPEEWRMKLDTWESRNSYKNLFINPAHEGHGTEAIQDAIDRGWIDDPGDVRWLANNTDREWTVNPLAHEDIRFAMQYLNRKEIVEELIDGFGDPRYSYMDTESEVWQDHFVEALEDEYDMSPEGDIELMEQMIEDAMEEIKENVSFGEVRYEEGYWQYRPPEEDWHDIEIIIIGRVEDWRNDLGNYIVDIFQDLGFNTSQNLADSATAIPLVFFGEPEPYDNLAYHIYTGDWFSSKAEYYQEDRLSQMYTPWYGFTQTRVEEESWNYDEEGYTERVQRLDSISKELYQGQLENKEEYWEKKVEATQLGFEESVRVFLLTERTFYPYNPNNVIRAVPETINGYDMYFGPRTMFTDNGKLETGFLYGAGPPGRWNLFGGSEDLRGDYQRRMLREYDSWNHPETGRPMEVNVYWSEGRETDPYERRGDIEWDYEWDGDDLIENIEISEKAVDYVAGDREWLDRDELIAEGYIEDEYAAVKATLDVHEEHIWHDGSNFSLQDVMAAYARNKELGDDTHRPYLESWDLSQSVWWESIHAIEWNEEDGTYTVYGDYTFPLEDKIGDHYSIFPEVHPLTYEGWNHLHGGDETEYGGIVDEDYNYEPYVGYWIHQLSPDQNEDLVKILEAMREDGWIPYYLREDTNAPIPINTDELTDQLESLIDFIETYNHSYIGAGPFWIEDLDKYTPLVMSLQRHDDYGFPFEGEEVKGIEFPYGYWPAQFEVQEVRLDSIETPDRVEIGEEFEASGIGYYAHLYPELEKLALTEDHLDDYRFTLRDEYEGEILVEVTAEDIDFIQKDGFSSFEAVISTEKIDIEGDYTLQLEVLGVGEEIFTTAGKIVTLSEEVPEPYFEVDIIDYDEETEEGETVTIEYQINNIGDSTAIQDIVFEVDGVQQYSYDDLKLGPNESYIGEFVWETQEGDAGDYDIEVSSYDDYDTASVSVVEVVRYDLIINIEGEGSVEVDGEERDDGWSYEYSENTEVILKASPYEGWEFVNWTGDYESTEEEITISMDEDKEITAVFVEDDDDDIPGFTLSFLPIASLIATIWHQRKIKDKNKK